MGIRLIAGRSFTEDDDDNARLVVIVDDRLAARAWPGESPIGRRLAVDPFVIGKPQIWATVVGMVQHVRHRSPVEEVRDQVYFPQRQVLRNPSVYIVKTGEAPPQTGRRGGNGSASPGTALSYPASGGAGGDPAAIVPAVRDALKKIDPVLPIYDVRPLTAYVEGANATRAFTMQLAVIFALVALALASVGYLWRDRLFGDVASSRVRRPPRPWRRRRASNRAGGARRREAVDPRNCSRGSPGPPWSRGSCAGCSSASAPGTSPPTRLRSPSCSWPD